MLKESIKQHMFMCLVDILCHFRGFLSTVRIIGCSLLWLTVLSCICSRPGIHMIVGSFILCLYYGRFSSFAISNAILFCQVLEETNKKVTVIKIYQKEEEFHMDGDLIKYHVQTISGRL